MRLWTVAGKRPNGQNKMAAVKQALENKVFVLEKSLKTC